MFFFPTTLAFLPHLAGLWACQRKRVLKRWKRAASLLFTPSQSRQMFSKIRAILKYWHEFVLENCAYVFVKIFFESAFLVAFSSFIRKKLALFSVMIVDLKSELRSGNNTRRHWINIWSKLRWCRVRTRDW